MSRKHQLRKDRSLKSPIINVTSAKQEADIVKALRRVVAQLEAEFGTKISFYHKSQWHLKDIVSELKRAFPKVKFTYNFDTSTLRPDGGVLFINGPANDPYSYPILISEVKNQGTNDLRAEEGLPKQSKGNAIERLGKNVIGLRASLLRESIFPFVCFGYGCDFAEDSSILDRVSTIAMFGQLNKTHLHNEEQGKFNRGSFYFRQKAWSVDEMTKIMTDIASRSVLYYFSKYTEKHFRER